MNQSEIGALIRDLRTQKGLTQRHIAHLPNAIIVDAIRFRTAALAILNAPLQRNL